MGCVLFSPIGNSDPIRGFHDGPWLHICRHYQPHTCILYLTAVMCRRENVIEADGSRKDLYARTLQLFNEFLFGNQTERYIQLQFERDPACEQAHSLEYFIPKFVEILNRIHSDFPDDELIVNVTSGTAGMQSALMVLSTMLPYKVQLVQVSDYEEDQNKKETPVNDKYQVEDEWELNEDNEPGSRDRTSPQPLVNLTLEMRINELCRLVQEGDYHTALQEAESDSLRERISAKSLLALQGAERRSNMKTAECASALIRSGFPLGDSLRKNADKKIWQCAEYLLTMKNDLKRGAFDEFMRKLTPLLVNLCELYLEKIGKDVRANGVGRNGKWIITKITPDWLEVLNRAYPRTGFVPTDLSCANMLPLIEAFGEPRPFSLVAGLRVAEKARNQFAHRIVPYGRKDVERELAAALNEKSRETPEAMETLEPMETPEAILNGLHEFLGIIQPFGSEYWHSYEAMNDHICALLKEGK